MAEGKIVKALSGFYYVQHEGGITQCRGRGVFRKNKITSPSFNKRGTKF